MTDRPRSAVLAEPWPVVLLHGTRTSHSQWDPQVPSLRAAGHAVWAPELPGHGDRRGEAFTLETALAVIEQVVRAAHRGAGLPVHLVGSSLGGLLAIPAAAHLTAETGVLGSLTACGAAIQPTPRLARLYGRLIAATDLLPGMSTGDSRVFAALLGADGARAYLRGGRADLSVVAPAFAAVASLDLRAELQRIQAPVTFLHGRREQLRLNERSFTRAAPHGHLEKLPYGDHMLNLNASHRFTADLLRVLALAQAEPVRPAPSRAGEVRGPRRS